LQAVIITSQTLVQLITPALTTATALSETKTLELYLMRWAIEVYFKEAKQHLGFLKEQSTLCGVYCFHPLNHKALIVLPGCDKPCAESTDINFAGKLWQVLRAVITGALERLKAVMDDAVAIVMDAIDAHIECWFLQVLQLDARSLRLEALEINNERLLYG
jgi:peroxiredoxin family protein